MRARCYRCQSTFETDHYGVQTCPSCSSEVYLPEPAPAPTEPAAPGGGGAAPPTAPPQGPTAPPPLAAPPQGPAAAPPGWSAGGWGGHGWTPGAAPPPWPPQPPGAGWSPLPPGAVPPVAEQSAPFAERQRRGLFSAFRETWRLAAFEPVRFFRQVRVSETRAAVLFGVIALTLGNWAALVFSYLTASATMGFVSQLARRLGRGRLESVPWLEMVQGYTLGSFVVQAVVMPLLALVAVYLTAAVFHVMLLVVRGAPRGFDATLTVVGYASGVFLLRAVPACGGIVAAVWFMVSAIHGLAEAQRCGTGKSTFAVLGPLFLACAVACMAATVAGIAGFGGFRGGGPPGSTGI